MDEYMVSICKRYQNAEIISPQKLQVEYQMDSARIHRILQTLTDMGLVYQTPAGYVPRISDKNIAKLEKQAEKEKNRALKEEQKHSKRM